MLHSLRTRLLIGFILVVALAVGTVAFIASRSTKVEFGRYVTHDQALRYRRLALILSAYYARARSWEGIQSLIDQTDQVYNERLVLSDRQGIVVGDSNNKLLGRSVNDDWSSESITLQIAGTPIGRLFIKQEERTPIEKAFLASVNKSVLIAAIVAGGAGILIALVYSRRIVNPVKALTSAARRMQEGKLDQRVEVSSQDEIGQLARTFNSMTAELKEQEKLRRNIVSDVAHELRGPLSNIQGYLEALKEGLAEPDPEIIGILHQEALLLSRLIDDLHDLAQAEAGKLDLNLQTVALEDIVTKTVDSIQNKTQEKYIELSLNLVNSTMVKADPQRMKQVLRNLLENSIIHTPPGGKINISVKVKGQDAQVGVSDTGEGISAADLPYIFERFYRADKSRSRSTGGSGLGLTIAKKIIEAHRGEIWAESEEGEGATFKFSLPLA